MASFEKKMNLSNFTCKFGSNMVMLDLFHEVILPAFIGDHVRKFSDASYFFIDVNLRNWQDQEMAIIGRIVKNTTLTREQIFTAGKIVEDHAEIDSAPTSVFVLLLSNHKLLYVRENSGSPSVSTFVSTISLFIGTAYKNWIREIYDERNSSGKITWKDLQKEFPPPSLEVTPIATESSVSAYVEKFKTINAVEIRLIETNHELDNLPIFGEMREIKEKISADDISLKSHKSGDVGLNKAGVAKLVSTPAQEGNSKITIRGKGLGGDSLVANNDSFNVSVPIPGLKKGITAAADMLKEKLESQISLGIINVKKGGEISMQKLANIISSISWQ
jgi:hypothetical protein